MSSPHHSLTGRRHLPTGWKHLPTLLLIGGFALLLAESPPMTGFAAELNARQKRIVESIDASVNLAGRQFQAGDYQRSAATVRNAIRKLDVASKAASPELYDSLRPVTNRIATLHTLLELERISLPPFQPPKRPATRPNIDENASSEPTGDRGTAMTPSFTADVAPILVNRCGRCHVRGARGEFSMNSYVSLMKGPPEGAVIFPGDVVASRLVETIETGAMPPNGDVPSDEQSILKAWIQAGAKFDGGDPAAPLPTMAAIDPTTTEPNTVPLRKATGNESVSFAADVAPLLVEHCRTCHIDAQQASGGLRLDTFAQLRRGGDSGSILDPGRGSESLLVRKLRGMAGARMPAGGRPALPEESIQTIETWIDEGAALDGDSEDQPLDVMSRLAWAASATAEQISEHRRTLAEKHLDLTVPQAGQVQRTVTDHFLVIGDASPATIEQVARVAEAQMKTVRRTVPGPEAADYFRGRASIFVLPRQYAYSEFARMVEGRGIPATWSSHWRYDGIDAYVAASVGEDAETETIEERLLAPLTSLAVATRGAAVPRWFAEGIGNAVAVRGPAAPKGESRRERETATAAAISATESGKAFLDGKLTPEQTDRVATAIAGTLLDRRFRGNFDRLIRLMGENASFEEAFAKAFPLPLADFLDGWLAWYRGAK